MVSLVVSVTVNSDMPRGEVQARTSLRNLEGVPRLHRMCERFGVPPTYLLTFPVANRPGDAPLDEILTSGRCEVGASLQPWTTPPFDAHEDRLVALSPHLTRASMVQGKLEHLTDAIEARFGRRPKAHRAAHGGLNGAGLQALERLGYTVDCSVEPFVDARPVGVDWRQAPEAPYYPDRQRPDARGSSPVMQVPLTIGWNRELPPTLARAVVNLPSAQRALANPWFPVADLVWLDPARSSALDMRSLARRTVERGLPVLHLSVRSNELWPGESATCPAAADVDHLLGEVESFLRYAVDELRAVPRTLSEFAKAYTDDVSCP